MKRILYSAIALIALGGCSEDQDLVSVMRGGEVRLCSSIATRTAGDEWESGDEIGVYMTSPDGDKSNIRYTTDASGVLTTETALYYPTEGVIDLLAYYPYVADLASAESYPVNVANQSDLGAIDLLTASIEAQVRSDEAVNLTFDHRLAHVVIKIAKSDDITDAEIEGMTVTLSGTRSTATYDLTSDEMAPTGEVVDIPLTIKDMSIEAIVVPQTLNGAKLLFGNTAYDDFETAIATEEFVSGMSYTYTATLQGTEVKLGDPTIKPWSTEEQGDLLGYISATGVDIKLTDSGIYEINSGRGLKAFADLVNGAGNTSSATTEGDILFEKGKPLTNINAELKADVSVAGAGEWLPIGNSSANRYFGLFDGKGHIIKGITMSPNQNNNMGLFGYISGAIINLGVSGRIFGCENVGGIVGYNNQGFVVNCYSVAEVRGEKSVGGIVGWNDGNVTACYGAGVVEASENIGGIVGYNNLLIAVSYCYYDREICTATEVAGGELTTECAAYTTATMQSMTLVDNLNRGADIFINESEGVINLYSWLQENNNYPSQFEGTPMSPTDLLLVDDVYHITSGRGLRAFLDLVNGYGNTTGAYTIGGIKFIKDKVQPTLNAVLDANISLEGIPWEPIGNNYAPYTGTFDGNGYEVSDLKIESGANFQGLFGGVGEGAVVKNLGVSGSIKSVNYTAGVVGENNGGTVVNCYSSVAVEGDNYVGGVVGLNNGGTVTACYATGEVIGASNVGAVVGANEISGKTTYCYFDNQTCGQTGVAGSTTPETCGKYSTAEMQSPIVASKLSAGAYFYNIASGDQLSAWRFTDCKYPTIDKGTVPAAPCDLLLKDDIYQIFTGKGLRAFADLVNGKSNTSGAAVEGDVKFNPGTPQNSINGLLIDNISLEGVEWLAINSYSGTFDGYGHVVSDLKIEGTNYDQGLFGAVETGGVIKNLGVSGSVSGAGNIGGVAGYSGGTIVNCYSSVDVTGEHEVGGIVGFNSQGTVTACYATGSANGALDVGAIVGANDGGTISYCYYDNEKSNADKVVGIDLSNATTYSGGYTTTTMQSEWLVSQLRIGADQYNSNNNGTARAWQYAEGKYPTITMAVQDPLTLDMMYDEANNLCLIYSGLGLKAFAEAVNNSKITCGAVAAGYFAPEKSHQNLNAKLINDVTLPDGNWETINANVGGIGGYSGTFDGNGKKISNLRIDSKYSFQAFIQTLHVGGVVKNLSVEGSVKGGIYASAIVADNRGTVVNCSSSVEVTGTNYVGGVVGNNNDTGRVITSYFTGAVNCTADTAGGIVGENERGAIVNSCYYCTTNCGNVTAVVGSGLGRVVDCAGYVSGKMQDGVTLVNDLNLGVYFYNVDKTEDSEKVPAWTASEDSYPLIDMTAPMPPAPAPDIDLVSRVYEIHSGKGLRVFADLVNGTQNTLNVVLGSGVAFNNGTPQLNINGKLTSNVSIAGAEWIPIGSSSNSYIGTFDGDGYKVSGITINSTNYLGLFGAIETGGTIMNLGVVDGSISGQYQIGGVVGWSHGTVLNCYSSVALTGVNCIGGVVGSNAHIITACYATGTVVGAVDGDQVGAVIGVNNSCCDATYCYYDTETCGAKVSLAIGKNDNEDSGTNCEGFPTTTMQDGTLTNYLNLAAYNYNDAVKGMGLLKWITLPNKYPIIIRGEFPVDPALNITD